MLSEAMEPTIGSIEHVKAGVPDDIKCKMSNWPYRVPEGLRVGSREDAMTLWSYGISCESTRILEALKARGLEEAGWSSGAEDGLHSFPKNP